MRKNKKNMQANEQPTESSFLMIPRAFVKDGKYIGLTPHAMILYGLMRDRSLMSQKRTGFNDEDGSYVIYRRDDICSTFRCGHDKAGRILKELETYGLVSTKQQGHNKPNKYYVENLLPGVGLSDARTSDIGQADVDISNVPDVGKQDRSYIYLNSYIDNSYTDQSQSIGYDPTTVENAIKENIEYNVLLEKDIRNKERLNELVSIMTDTVCGSSETVTIGRANQPRGRVRERFLNYDAATMEYVLDRLKENKTKVRNIRAYLLTTLFNAPATMNIYYDALVQQDCGT